MKNEKHKYDISIVVPCYNSEATIKETLESIISQSANLKIQLIVIDGGSNDGTVEICKTLGVHNIISEKDKGQSDAINKGIQLADSPILAWQNADDTYNSGCFQSVIHAFRNNPDVDIIYSNYYTIDADGEKIAESISPKWSTHLFKIGRFVPMQPTVFFSRRAWDLCGPLDLKRKYTMDVAFFARCASMHLKFLHIDSYYGNFRSHAGSLTTGRTNRMVVLQEHIQAINESLHLTRFERIQFWLVQYILMLRRYQKTGKI